MRDATRNKHIAAIISQPAELITLKPLPTVEELRKALGCISATDVEKRTASKLLRVIRVNLDELIERTEQAEQYWIAEMEKHA